MSMMFFVSIFSYFLTFLLIFIPFLWYLWWKKVKLYDHIPTPKNNIPILGHVLRVPSKAKDLIAFQKQLYDDVKGKLRVVWLLFQPIVDTKDVESIECILKSTVHIEKGLGYNILKEWIGDGLLISKGEKWRLRRKLLTPAFHFDILKPNFLIMKHHAEELIKFLKIKDFNKPLEVSSIAKYFSLNVICETSMGVRCDIHNISETESDEAKYVEAVDNLLHMIIFRFLKPWYRSAFVYRYFSTEGKKFYSYLKTAKQYVENVIAARIKALEGIEEIKSAIFLDILIAAYKRNEIDVEGIIEEVNTFMFEGHDTVSSAISWTIYLLGRNERVQNELFEEISDLSFNEISLDDISKLKYLDCVIKESLRIHPPVPGISRFLKNDTFISKNVKVPANTPFGMNIYHMQRDEAYWKDPLKFCPERFSEDNKEYRNPFSFVPFSAGPRNCIGQRFAMMELKVVIFNLLKNFQFVSIHKEDEIEEQADIIHRSGNGIWVKISDRN